jgi:t-SNARE complex subunit (syntaxin)
MIPYGGISISQDRLSNIERSIEDMKDLYQKDMSNLVSELQNKLNKSDIECIESKINIIFKLP